MSHPHTALIASLEHQAEADRATIKSLRGTVSALKNDVAALTAQVRALKDRDAVQAAVIHQLRKQAKQSQTSGKRLSGQTTTASGSAASTSESGSGASSPLAGRKGRRLSLASACSGESSGVGTPLPAHLKSLVLVSWLSRRACG
jgi:septal ring factor EnvC (AmiA/AmiB activator)